MRTHTRMRPLLGIAAAAALLLAACGDDDDSGSSSDTTAAAATTAAPATTAGGGGAATTAAGGGEATGEPIKVTTIYQGKSGLAVDPNLPDGAKAAVKVINDSGGINGRPIEYSPCDDQGDNTRARTCATDAVGNDTVAAVGTVTTLGDVYLPEFAKAGLPSLGAYTNAPEDFTNPMSFPMIGGTRNSPAAVANALARGGAKKIGLAHIDTGSGSQTFQDRIKLGLDPFGLELAATAPFPATPPDMAPYVTASTANGVDGVIVWGLAADVISYVQELRSQGSDIPVAVVTNDYPTVFEQLGDQAVGLVTQNDYYPANFTDVGAVQRMTDAFKAAGVEGSLDDPYAVNSYAAMMAFAEIAKKLPEVTREALVAELAKTTGLDIGLTSPLQFVTGNRGGLGERIFNNCVFLTKYDGTAQTPIVDEWIDPIANETCPSPSKS